MSRRKTIPGRMPEPFTATVHKTERSAAAVLMHWMRQIIEEQRLELGMPDVETGGADRKLPDLIIYRSRRSPEVLCVGEVKLPFFDVFDSELKDKTRKEANRRKAPYFFTTNFRELVWWKTEAANNPQLPESEQIVDRFHLSEISDLREIEQHRFSEPIRRELARFLRELSEVATNRAPEPKLPIDELLIFWLQERIRILAHYYQALIRDRCHKDRQFAGRLARWFNEQNWNFTGSDDDFDRAARQTAYLLINKILFYHALQARRPDVLGPLNVPDGLSSSGVLQRTLQGFFEDVLKIDYQTIYTADFIDSLAFPDDRDVVLLIVRLVNALRRYDFSRLGYDIIGRIFEQLIPEPERHNLGQYFTRADVVDLILRFCLRHEQDKVLDPACGAGTFLVRAYQHKKLMNSRLTHEAILKTLWGNDIAKFPAHLATINLAICDLSSEHNYPNVIQEDFFALRVGEEGFMLPEAVRCRIAQTLNLEPRMVTYPRWFDVIVGNPPYTRQEEIPAIGVDKGKLIEDALKLGNRKIADISRRAGIHAYFFVHGTKFLKEGGRFGFIVSNSWLDVDYGKGLQEFFLQNYKIVAIIESKVEPWFKDADINTCIVILEKCSSKKERDNNRVRFVYLKKQLREFVPPAQDIWEKQLERLRVIDALIQTIIAHDRFYENEELRIYPKLQSELWAEGYDAQEGKYAGSKWGKYLRAPQIFFKILEKGKGKLVPLKELAEVRFGIKTGANEFFYLTEEQIKRWGIERRFLKPIIFSLKEVRGYKLNKSSLRKKVIICHKTKNKLKGTNLLKYILWGERRGYNRRPTCAARGDNTWYYLGHNWDYAPLIFPAKIGERMPVFLNYGIFEDKKLYGVTPKRRRDILLIGALLNSTLARFFIEYASRQLTGSQAIADIDVIVVESLLIPHSKNFAQKSRVRLIAAFKKLLKRDALSIFDELGAKSADEVALDKVKPDRRELDKIIMGDILGLTEEEQLEVYRAVVDLVRARLEKAKGVKKGRRKQGFDIQALKAAVIKELEGLEE